MAHLLTLVVRARSLFGGMFMYAQGSARRRLRLTLSSVAGSFMVRELAHFWLKGNGPLVAHNSEAQATRLAS